MSNVTPIQTNQTFKPIQPPPPASTQTAVVANPRIASDFIYVGWDFQLILSVPAQQTSYPIPLSSIPALRFYSDDSGSYVQTTSSIGSYKNAFGNIVLARNRVYEWQVRIVRGGYFKIGVMKKCEICHIQGAFSDNPTGYAYYSQAKLRNNSKKTGDTFGLPFGPGDIVNVRFNTRMGTLEFGLNQDAYKLAFTVQDFKLGGYVPAVAGMMEGSKYGLVYPVMED